MTEYDDIIVALRRITRAIDLQSKKLARISGLTAPQILVMQAIRDLDNPTVSAVARNVVLSQATVTNILDRLEKHLLIRRERRDRDKRVVHLMLTETGEGRLTRAPELLQAGFLREYHKLEDWERNLLIAAVQRIAAMMDAEDIDAAPVLTIGDMVPRPGTPEAAAGRGSAPGTVGPSMK